MRLVVERSRRDRLFRNLMLVAGGALVGVTAKDSLEQWLTGENYILIGLFSLIILALIIAFAEVMSRALPVVVVEAGGMAVPAIPSWGLVAWSDLIDARLRNGDIRLRFTARNGRPTLFSVRKAECEAVSYQMMLDMIRERRPDLFEAKTTELGTV